MAFRPQRALILSRGSGTALSHERRLVERITNELPQDTYLQIWSGFEIFDHRGAAHEIDIVALGHYGLYVIEVKQYSGRVVEIEPEWSLETREGTSRLVLNPLPLVRRNAQLLEALLVQEIGRGISVEPLILLPNKDVEIGLPQAARRYVVTTGELVRGLRSGELPGDVGPPSRVPVDAATAHTIANLLEGARRRVRPGRGSLMQELSLLQRDVVADLTAGVTSSDPGVSPSAGSRGDDLKHRIEEAAAVWVIACVFIRVLEERGYIKHVLAGEGVEAHEHALLAGLPSSTPREALLHLLSAIRELPACKSILGLENHYLWDLIPGEQGAGALLSFFRLRYEQGRDRDRAELSDDRLWIDLYRDISEPLHKANSLLPTPSFIEDFLLSRTLDPAIEEIDDVAQVRVMDPACGSGILLVGAFRRLLDQLLARHPSTGRQEQALAALAQVHGVDISPAATMITRIRLLLEYCEASGTARLSDISDLQLHVTTVDSLLPSRTQTSVPLPDSTGLLSPTTLLTERYSVVVCAPPFITVRDAARREAYRGYYQSARGRFALTSPFIERCFQLADDGGFVGVLVNNSFMKRDFGRPLVEAVLSTVDLTHVIDTSGAYIPGYGTPTTILVGRNRPPTEHTIRVVVGKRGEPITPIDPAEGHVWSSIVAHLDYPGYEDEYLAVRDVQRDELAHHPWSLGAPDAMALRQTIERGAVPLQDLVPSVHSGAESGLDQVYVLPRRVAERFGFEHEVLRPLIRGSSIRDFSFSTEEVALVPPEREPARGVEQHSRWLAWLQRFRPVFSTRRSFGAVAPTPWWAWLRAPRASVPCLCIIGPAIATNNHFTSMHGELVASHSVLVLDLGDARSENELYALLGFLNSSTASFWMKQIAPSKGYVSAGAGRQPLYDLTGVINRLPIPRAIVEHGVICEQIASLAKQLEGTATDLAAAAPERVIERWDRTSREALVESLADAQLRERTLLRRMVCEQEDLDWLVYEAVGLTRGEPRILKGSALPQQRPFTWLTDEPPVGLDRRLTEVWRRRRKLGQECDPLRVLETAPYKRTFRGIESARDVGLDLYEHREELGPDGDLPTPERRDSMDYARRTKLACERWLLDRLEEIFRDMPPQCASVQELSSRFGAAAGVATAVLVHAEERGEVSPALLERCVTRLLRDHGEPYLAALRHTELGLAKRAAWKAAWELQRRRDVGELVASNPVPPSYSRTDYRDASTFLHRGKLDVATEPFITYPAGGDEDRRYGWTGWTPVQQAEALVALVMRCQNEGRAAAHVVPLLTGILELVSWMPSWDGVVPAPGSPAEEFQLRVQHEAARIGLDIETLQAWRPPGTDRPDRNRESPRS